MESRTVFFVAQFVSNSSFWYCLQNKLLSFLQVLLSFCYFLKKFGLKNTISLVFQSYLLRFGVLGMFLGSKYLRKPGVWKPRVCLKRSKSFWIGRNVNSCSFLSRPNARPSSNFFGMGDVYFSSHGVTPPKTNMAGWKNTIFNRRYIFKWLVLHCHVSFPWIYFYISDG